VSSTSIDPLKCSPAEYFQYLQEQCARLDPTRREREATPEFEASFRHKWAETYGVEAAAQLAEFMAEVKEVGPDRTPGTLSHLVSSHASDILEIASELGAKQDREVAFGALPTGEINAITVQVPAGGCLILIDDGTPTLIWLMAKAISTFFVEGDGSGVGDMAIFRTDEESLRYRLGTHTEGLTRFTEALFAHVVLGHAGRARPYLLKSPHLGIAELLTETAEKFIIAHELAHIHLGHSAGSSNLGDRLVDHRISVKEIVRSRHEELAADLGGLHMTLAYNANKKLDTALSYWGIEFLLSCLEVVEEVVGEGTSMAYPPATERRVFLRRFVSDKWPEYARGMLGLGSTTQWLVTQVWERAKPLFFAAADKYFSSKPR
jgi:hypothetical protein